MNAPRRKKRRSESCITALPGSDNVVHTGGKGIQSVLSSFYADLFSKETDLSVQASLRSKVSIESLLTGWVTARVHFPLHSVLLLCRVWRRVRPRVSMDYQ